MKAASPEAFSYKAVERALARVNLIPDDALAAFRGRLQHFQRIGITPSTPGRGRRIEYQRSDVYHWALALEFEQFGMDPKIVKRILEVCRRNWDSQFTDRAEAPDQFLYFHPALIGRIFPKRLQQGLNNPKGVPFSITGHVIFDIADLDRLVGSHPLAQTNLKRFKNRYGMINISSLRLEVDEALEASV